MSTPLKVSLIIEGQPFIVGKISEETTLYSLPMKTAAAVTRLTGGAHVSIFERDDDSQWLHVIYRLAPDEHKVGWINTNKVGLVTILGHYIPSEVLYKELPRYDFRQFTREELQTIISEKSRETVSAIKYVLVTYFAVPVAGILIVAGIVNGFSGIFGQDNALAFQSINAGGLTMFFVGLGFIIIAREHQSRYKLTAPIRDQLKWIKVIYQSKKSNDPISEREAVDAAIETALRTGVRVLTHLGTITHPFISNISWTSHS